MTVDTLLDGFFAGGAWHSVKGMARRQQEGNALKAAIRSRGFEPKFALMTVDETGAPSDAGELVVQVAAIPWGERELRVPLTRALVRLARRATSGTADARKPGTVHVIVRGLEDGVAACLRITLPIRDPDDGEEALDVMNRGAAELLRYIVEAVG